MRLLKRIFRKRTATVSLVPVLVTIAIKDHQGNVKDVRNQNFQVVDLGG
jgi:hypothetical protein